MTAANPIVDLLRQCISLPTHQRHRDSTGDEMAFCRALEPIVAALAPDELVVASSPRGDGTPGAYLFARWGTPSFCINAHIDTVPPNDGWTHSPWEAQVVGDRVVGLGACDTKAAIACTLVLLQQRPDLRRDIGILFSGDEENDAAILPVFLASPQARGIKRVLVCEPSSRKLGTSHRGIFGYKATVRGPGGHSSLADSTTAPVLELAQLGVDLKKLCDTSAATTNASANLCFNLGKCHGGVAFNVIPQVAELTWSIRPAPGFNSLQWTQELSDLLAQHPNVTHEIFLDQGPFATHDSAWWSRAAIDATATPPQSPPTLGPLDFWTEAALWSAAGIDAVVAGPGDIANAHSPDESVGFDDLAWFSALLGNLLTSE